MARIDYYKDANAPKPNSLVVAASAIVTDKENNILLHKRADNNSWSTLGGSMELGESVSETILREIKEESGFDTKIEKLIAIYSDPDYIVAYSDGEVRQQFSICFHCSIIGGNLKISNESKELKFFSINEISNIKMHSSQKLRINDYLKNNNRPFIR